MTALMDAVATATASVPRVYAVGAVPPAPSYPYGVYSAQTTRADGYTIDAQRGLRWFRVTFQAFGRSANGALDLTDQWLAVLLDKTLTVGAKTTAPLRIELDPTPPIRDPDDAGVIGMTTTLTATIEEP